MLLVFYLLSILSFSFGCEPILEALKNYKKCVCGVANTRRIVGGSITQPNEYPWQALLHATYHLHGVKVSTFICGGSVITKKHILTADHCVDNLNKDRLEVYLGVHDREELSPASAMQLSKISRHKSQEGKNNLTLPDVAILTLKHKIIAFNEKIRPICFPSNTNDLFVKRYAIVTGWGNTLDVGSDDSNYLKKAEVMVTSNLKCYESYKHQVKIHNYNICTDRRKYQVDEKQAFCSGDSGGPLAITENGRLTLAGVISFSHKKSCNSRENEVYTRINHPSVLEWIEEVVEDDEDQEPAWNDKCKEIFLH